MSFGCDVAINSKVDRKAETTAIEKEIFLYYIYCPRLFTKDTFLMIKTVGYLNSLLDKVFQNQNN